ncbi:ABC transporter substrate-binding protein [Acrocarpospora macrocephala]|uniref:Lipoprotein n=1 Tax=Acrocarpospora macrocephala TaxID=150177 RepID=A0A5M3WF31_9ACTN|nr:ABC transporter substrate-binding protein [Acrocarpospora macrocephala]GES07695.1 lipoprotein [Acrocarpospora macrocephala]
MKRLLAGGLLLVLAACGQAAPPTAPAEQAAAPITVRNCGRTLTFDKPPSKVVTGYQPALETLLALGLQDKIAARTAFEENGPDGFLPGQKAAYDAIPQISDTIMLPQKEVMLAQGADFVIDNGQSSFDAAGGYATVDELQAAGAPVFILGNWCSPEETLKFTIEQTFTDLRDLGIIFGVQDRAEKLITDLRAALADVEKRVSGLPKVRILATDGGTGPVTAYGGAGLMNQMITLAGGENVLADTKADYSEFSVEQVAASNPDALLVLDYVVYDGKAVATADKKAADVLGVVKNSPAAKEKRTMPVPAAAAHPGYRNILAIVEIAKFLHPDAFTR